MLARARLSTLVKTTSLTLQQFRSAVLAVPPLDGDKSWYDTLERDHFKPIYGFKRDLMKKHRSLQFDNFSELYNHLALNHREELFYYDICGNNYFLTYENGDYNWQMV